MQGSGEPLDLSFCTVPHPVTFWETTFDATAYMRGAHLPALSIVACKLTGLEATGIRLEQYLDVRGTEVSGALRLDGAKIGGALDCSGAVLSNAGDDALFADRVEIAGSMFCGSGFIATGTVRLVGARIGGQLECSGATLSNRGGDALAADGAEIAGGVFLRDGSAAGTLRLLDARIGGVLDCSGAALSNEGDDALLADRAAIVGGVFFRDGFNATGRLRFRGARIASLDCSGATFNNKGGDALAADGAEIAGVVYLREGFNATGTVRLVGARIGGQLECSGATLSNRGGDALAADGAEIGAVFLRAGFSAVGMLRLVGATIAGQFALLDATLVNPNAIALNARSALLRDSLIFRNVRVVGGIDLFRARATSLDDDVGKADDPLGSWRGVEPLVLDGFAYDRFGQDTNSDSKLRRGWLRKTFGFEQGAWQQLIEVYRKQGRDDDATRTAVAMHNDRMARAGLPRHRKAGRYVLRVVVGHGYRPWLALIWGGAIVAAFGLVVWHWSEMFVPGKTGVTGSPQPIAYSADTFLPIINLGQADDWTPTGWVRWVTWSVILLGWSLTTIFVTGFTRIVRS